MYKKEYPDRDEDEMRLNIFLKNRKMINIHNRLYKEGLVTFTMALDQYADLTTTEIIRFKKIA